MQYWQGGQFDSVCILDFYTSFNKEHCLRILRPNAPKSNGKNSHLSVDEVERLGLWKEDWETMKKALEAERGRKGAEMNWLCDPVYSTYIVGNVHIFNTSQVDTRVSLHPLC